MISTLLLLITLSFASAERHINWLSGIPTTGNVWVPGQIVSISYSFTEKFLPDEKYKVYLDRPWTLTFAKRVFPQFSVSADSIVTANFTIPYNINPNNDWVVKIEKNGLFQWSEKSPKFTISFLVGAEPVAAELVSTPVQSPSSPTDGWVSNANSSSVAIPTNSSAVSTLNEIPLVDPSLFLVSADNNNVQINLNLTAPFGVAMDASADLASVGKFENSPFGVSPIAPFGAPEMPTSTPVATDVIQTIASDLAPANSSAHIDVAPTMNPVPEPTTPTSPSEPLIIEPSIFPGNSQQVQSHEPMVLNAPVQEPNIDLPAAPTPNQQVENRQPILNSPPTIPQFDPIQAQYIPSTPAPAPLPVYYILVPQPMYYPVVQYASPIQPISSQQINQLVPSQPVVEISQQLSPSIPAPAPSPPFNAPNVDAVYPQTVAPAPVAPLQNPAPAQDASTLSDINGVPILSSALFGGSQSNQPAPNSHPQSTQSAANPTQVPASSAASVLPFQMCRPRPAAKTLLTN